MNFTWSFLRRVLRPMAVLLIIAGVASSHGSDGSTVDSSTLTGKVLIGYQGWFRCPDDGSGANGWPHWTRQGMTPTADTIAVDLYPDLSDFDVHDLILVPTLTVRGKNSYLYSGWNGNVISKHFAWMQRYGLDGILLQRFLASAPIYRKARDLVVRNVQASAEQHGRVFAIEYDLSQSDARTIFNALQTDWTYLSKELKITSSRNYLHHEGKPVVSIWGIGFSGKDHPPSDPAVAKQIIEWFKTIANVTLIEGTPSRWRSLTNDSASDARWNDIFAMADVVQPWTVGRYDREASSDKWKDEMARPDVLLASSRHQLYMPVIFPGFSWHNLNHSRPGNEIPRNGGKFLWHQAYNAQIAGAKMLKIAMFDEVNEGTAIFKTAPTKDQTPDQGYWLTLDADGVKLPSDWYLRLAGEITRSFQQGTQLPREISIRP